MKTIIVATADDWEAFYADGRRIAEGHRVAAVDLLEALGYRVAFFGVKETWLEGHGYNFPATTAELIGAVD